MTGDLAGRCEPTEVGVPQKSHSLHGTVARLGRRAARTVTVHGVGSGSFFGRFAARCQSNRKSEKCA